MAEEIPLTGGNVAQGVVRVGDTVRKPPTDFDPAVTALLDALSGVAGCPRALGIDDKGRRILSWVAGATDGPAAQIGGMAALRSAAALLRQIHDASVPLLGSDHQWARSDPDAQEVICHNDFAPYNMTFADDGRVIGVIDFDLAGPGPRLRDLAYMAWWMLPLGQPDAGFPDDKRLSALFDGYGIAPTTQLVPMIAAVLRHMGDPQAARAMIGAEAAGRLAAGGHFAHWQGAAADFAEVRGRLHASIAALG